MRRTKSTLALAAAVSLAPVCALAQGMGEGEAPAPGPKAPAHRPWQDIPVPPLRPYTAPKPERHVLPNGLVVFLLEDHELPTVDLVMLARTGEVFESRERAGLASMCGEVMRSGGTSSRTGDELDQLLEDMAASVEVSIGPDEGRASLSCLKESFDATLPILVDVIEHPAFRQEKIDLAKKRAKSHIARRNDDPAGVARREFARALYGDKSPYGWTAELATVEAITRDELVLFHRSFFGLANRTIIGVVGDFDAKAMLGKIEQGFGAWKPAETELKSPSEVQDGPPPKVLLARKTDVNQATVVMGHIAIQRRPSDPDYAPLMVANDVLGGGGFSARLMQHVRTDMGLAYGVSSRLAAPYSHRGTFTLFGQTKSESTLPMIAAMRKELDRLIAEPVSAHELKVAKDSIVQQLVFENETRAQVIERALRMEYNGFPQDYLEQLQAAIASVSVEDVQRVAKKYFHPEKMVTLVVGNDKEFEGSLSALGAVEEIDIRKPAWTNGGKADGAQAAKDRFTPEALAKGRALVTAAVAAKGGREALEKVRSVDVRGTGTRMTPNGPLPVELRHLVVFPDRVRVEMTLPFGVLVYACSGGKAWARSPQGVQDLPEERAKDLAEQAAKDEVPLLLRLDAPDGKVAFTGKEKVGDGELDVVETADGVRLYFDGQARLVRRSEKAPEGERTAVWSDFRDVGGVMFPFAARTLMSGEDVFSMTVKSIETNIDVPPDAFAKPAAAERPHRAPEGTEKKNGSGDGK